MTSKVTVTVLSAAAVIICARPAAPVINGIIDTSHECVGSLHSSTLGFICTGTLIDASWVLTSAACALQNPDRFAMGPDYAVSPRLHAADYSVIHPSFDGSASDYALVHLATPATGESTCTATAPPDGISAGTQVITVGYGLVSFPAGATTARHRTINTVSGLDAAQLFFDTSSSGPCLGDEGGPNLTVGGTQVLGVISTMDGNCSVFTLSGRVSAIHDVFIVTTILDPPGIFFDGFESGSTSGWGP